MVVTVVIVVVAISPTVLLPPPPDPPSSPPPQTISISNLGRVDNNLPGAGDFQLTAPRWGITEHGLFHYLFVAVSSQAGHLYLTVTYAEPVISEETANRLVDGIITRFTDVAKDGGESTRAQATEASLAGA